jgi:hypothetical protein
LLSAELKCPVLHCTDASPEFIFLGLKSKEREDPDRHHPNTLISDLPSRFLVHIRGLSANPVRSASLPSTDASPEFIIALTTTYWYAN